MRVQPTISEDTLRSLAAGARVPRWHSVFRNFELGAASASCTNIHRLSVYATRSAVCSTTNLFEAHMVAIQVSVLSERQQTASGFPLSGVFIGLVLRGTGWI